MSARINQQYQNYPMYAVEKLPAIVQIKAMVLRDRSLKEIPVEEIVLGDAISELP